MGGIGGRVRQAKPPCPLTPTHRHPAPSKHYHPDNNKKLRQELLQWSAATFFRFRAFLPIYIVGAYLRSFSSHFLVSEKHIYLNLFLKHIYLNIYLKAYISKPFLNIIFNFLFCVQEKVFRAWGKHSRWIENGNFTSQR